ncbi:hypothetical protein L210DRAFT_3501128 [Boletus edulis BED1]|uniref:Uncharacterized protein n=1 Tax=Boletus edulis BED1 TaxID=1328754 RepID=A0AAD4C3C1_BOLED|nr:hypothetical protein L210DRAFT_3501128 [Boletus edulis BED1]
MQALRRRLRQRSDVGTLSQMLRHLRALGSWTLNLSTIENLPHTSSQNRMNSSRPSRSSKRALPYAQPITFSRASDARSQGTVTHSSRTTITLPKTIPKGRWGRSRPYSGEGIQDDQGGISNWVVTAQLLKMHPPVPLPRSAKRRGYYGWAMVDAGNFAVHILSQEARQKYFLNQSQW